MSKPTFNRRQVDAILKSMEENIELLRKTVKADSYGSGSCLSVNSLLDRIIFIAERWPQYPYDNVQTLDPKANWFERWFLGWKDKGNF